MILIRHTALPGIHGSADRDTITPFNTGYVDGKRTVQPGRHPRAKILTHCRGRHHDSHIITRLGLPNDGSCIDFRLVQTQVVTLPRLSPGPPHAYPTPIHR